MADLLFEIGCEELPASYLEPALTYMRQEITRALKAEELNFKSVRVEGTPRRLVLVVRGLADKQLDKNYEISGPKIEIAYESSGKLSKAGLGFLRSKGLSKDKAYKKDTKKGEVIAAQVREKGKATSELLPDILQKIMREMATPKKMQWEPSKALFARPVRWILCLFDGKVVKIKFADVQSSDKTCGHRFLSPKFERIKSTKDYFKFLERNSVILSAKDRQELILSEAVDLAKKCGGELRIDLELVNTVANMVEHPWILVGHFESEFLQVPKEILISAMREHQKYFAVQDRAGELLPYFIVIASVKPKNKKEIGAGNARVLRARFEDGAFYYKKDVEQSLQDFSERLEKVMFQRQLGTVADKMRRVKKLAAHICDELALSKSLSQNVEKAAHLCKADLASGVVLEFPDLQGIMGKIYALKDGENPQVADAIEQHYWPRFATDNLPNSDEATVLALADRIDTLVGIIAIGKIPKGNADLFALRRAAIAVCKIITNRGYRLSLGQVLKTSLDLFDTSFKMDKAEILKLAFEFIIARARGVFVDFVSSYKVSKPSVLVDATVAVRPDDFTDLLARLKALAILSEKRPSDFAGLCATFKRTCNIVKKACLDKNFEIGNNFANLVEPAEIKLLERLKNAQSSFAQINNLSKDDLLRNYGDILTSIASLKPHVDKFFDNVMVMSDDKKLRQTRLSLLAKVEDFALSVADFNKIRAA